MKNDLEIINNTVTELVMQFSVSSIENPFCYLWMVNFVRRKLSDFICWACELYGQEDITVEEIKGKVY